MTTPGNTPNPPVTIILSDGKEYQIAMIENRHLLRLEEGLRRRRIRELEAFTHDRPIGEDDLEAFIRIRDEEITGQQLAQYSTSIGAQIALGTMAITECNPNLDALTVERLISNDPGVIMNAIMPPAPAIAETDESKGSDPTPPEEMVKKTDQPEVVTAS